MKYLLDTHTAVWWWTEPNQLSKQVFDVISDFDNQIFVSPINLWEISIKHRKGKWDEAKLVIENFERLMSRDSFLLASVKLVNARLAGSLPQPHADPFDRMLVAQAISEDLTLISKDEKLHQFDVEILW